MTMKQIISILLLISFIISSCGSNNEKPKTETTTTKETKVEETKPVAEQLYSCSMHPEVKGKKDEKCPKCGMFLTVPVKE